MNPFLMYAIAKKIKKSGRMRELESSFEPTIMLMIFGVPAVLGGGLFTLVNLGQKEIDEQQKQEASIIEKLEPVRFEAGKHIISVPIEENLEEQQVFEYHPGYKPVGIASCEYGKSYDFKDAFILYVNETEVEAKVTSIDGDDYNCEEFGTPLDNDLKEICEDEYTITYPEGTHLISVPVKNKEDAISQFEPHEGYEPIGFATANKSLGYDLGNESIILYINVEPVELEKNEENKYTEFGKPKEEQKVIIKK